MKILMLGWEYPPHKSGGLGTACEGLTVALARLGIQVDFVVPQLLGGEAAPHMNLVDSSRGYFEFLEVEHSEEGSSTSINENIRKTAIAAALYPYWTEEEYREYLATIQKTHAARKELFANYVGGPGGDSAVQANRYGSNMFDEVERYTANVVALLGKEDFDIIHAHDWMTLPAAVALKKLTGKPLIVHMHSLEFDRSGSNGNHRISEIERHGVHVADRVVAVSYYTRDVITREYGVPHEKISIVHNGVYPKNVVKEYREEEHIDQKVVLFLGRITFQKGPDYFVEAAAKVIPLVPDVLFIMAGSGDMLPRMMTRVKELGIESHFRFPGFLKGEEVEHIFSLADLYVMPSVSEPFGISALEAISFDTPVIISKQSGVSEVLGHALKVDFWDVDRLADLIINGLIHEELRQDMISMAREELKRLRWDAAAMKVQEIYQRFM